MKVAADLYSFEVKVGRFLRGWPLTTAIVLREFLLMLITASGYPSRLVAPTWVVVRERTTQRVVGRVSAGREPDAGPELLDQVEFDAAFLSNEQFLARYLPHLVQ